MVPIDIKYMKSMLAKQKNVLVQVKAENEFLKQKAEQFKAENVFKGREHYLSELELQEIKTQMGFDEIESIILRLENMIKQMEN